MILFHPLVEKWFKEKYSASTGIQELAWPKIASGEHVLITAPTGSGKTLTAFLWAINQLIMGAWPAGTLRVLYVSPLKALNNDIRKNLVEPLTELRECFYKAGEKFPDIQVKTRSGDTPQGERQRMIKKPPDILITTPESLNLLLLSIKAPVLFSGLATVILDEIHAVAGTKRGTHLITAVDRLVRFAGEFQRIALSATVKPIENVAGFVGGYKIIRQNNDYEKRKVSVIQSGEEKAYKITVCAPGQEGSWWNSLIEELKDIINKNRTTLLFTNSRQMTEKITRLINESCGYQLVYSHHGSLARELRSFVEHKLKEGELKAIVATSSLELGIDIGQIDEVILIQAPFFISSGIQRAGRAGHRVAEVSRISLFGLYAKDFLKAAVMARAIFEQDIEPLTIPLCPLDILAQIILSMTSTEIWDKNELYYFIKASYPFYNLTEEQFFLILEMLAGRYADSRIRELRPRVVIDRTDNTIQARKGSKYLLCLAGGTIPDRGYYTMREASLKSKIGELEEEFVWERHVGDSFIFGTQTWKITNIDHQNVEVTQVKGKGGMAPFWKAENMGRDAHFSGLTASFLEYINNRLHEPEILDLLKNRYFMEEQAARRLIDFLRLQKEATGTDLPHKTHLVIEHCNDPLNQSGSKQVILHTVWGGKCNKPFIIAIARAWEEEYGYPLQYFHDDDSILIHLPHNFNAGELFRLVTPENLDRLIRKKLESTGLFGALFRLNAGRALLLPKQGFNRRMPLWLNRLRSKKLLASVLKYEDFPILAETWRTCLQDEFDLTTLKEKLERVRQGEIKVHEVTTKGPSPFSSSLMWRQTNKYIYDDDTPLSSETSHLKQDIFKSLVFSSDLRPQIPDEVIRLFLQKVQRLFPGYAPSGDLDLISLLKERLFIPQAEWQELLQGIKRDHGINPEELIGPVRNKIKMFRYEKKSFIEVFDYSETGPEDTYIIHRDDISRLKRALEQQDETLIQMAGQWLQFYGPVKSDFLKKAFFLDNDQLESVLNELVKQGCVLIDYFSKGVKQKEICDTQNIEHLLRLLRQEQRVQIEPLEIRYLPLFLAGMQNLIYPGSSEKELQTIMEGLFGFPAGVRLWEEELFPARLSIYYSAWLDSLLQSSPLIWLGAGREKVTFCFEDDRELFIRLSSKQNEEWLKEALTIFPGFKGRYSFWELAEQAKKQSAELADKLWQMAWRGMVTTESFHPVRMGIACAFKPGKLSGQKEAPQTGESAFNPLKKYSRPRQRRHSFYNRWKTSRPLSGTWLLLRHEPGGDDPLYEEELTKDRVRQLLARYGILFRELLENELPYLKWGRVFKSLRLMEFSGEVLAGFFFKGIPGLQFISYPAFKLLQADMPRNAVYWMNACDPASLSGIKLESLKGSLPARIASNHLVYHGTHLVLVSRKRGRLLEFRIPPDNKNIIRYLDFFKVLLNRQVNPLKRIKVEEINGLNAAESPYKRALIEFGFKEDYKCLFLRGSV